MKTLWPILSEPLTHGLRRLIRPAANFAALYLLLYAAFEWYLSTGCSYQVLANISDVSGFDFRVSMRDCWPGLETSVSISKSGHRRKTRIFVYDSPDLPTITSVNERTVLIVLGDISYIYCRTDEWEGLTIKYDIRSVAYPRSRELQECKE